MPGPRMPENERREQIVSAAYRIALRAGIDGVTLRAVAGEANVSHGLVAFHFKGKDPLIGALLDRVLATTPLLHIPQELTDSLRSARHLATVLHEQLNSLTSDPRGTRLFFEYWSLGVRRADIRRKIAAALERYRLAFTRLAEAMPPIVLPDGSRVTSVAVAAVAVSLISGCAVQMMIDPKQFDTNAYLTVAKGMIEQLYGHST
jgi:TetR/AcrR family transcriptional regulator, transcriptional repressor of bet genes